jgi:hypothetical protein
MGSLMVVPGGRHVALVIRGQRRGVANECYKCAVADCQHHTSLAHYSALFLIRRMNHMKRSIDTFQLRDQPQS